MRVTIPDWVVHPSTWKLEDMHAVIHELLVHFVSDRMDGDYIVAEVMRTSAPCRWSNDNSRGADTGKPSWKRRWEDVVGLQKRKIWSLRLIELRRLREVQRPPATISLGRRAFEMDRKGRKMTECSIVEGGKVVSN